MCLKFFVSVPNLEKCREMGVQSRKTLRDFRRRYSVVQILAKHCVVEIAK
jgi:hypothetical protein